MQTHQKVFWTIFVGFVLVVVIVIMSMDSGEPEKAPDLVVEEPLTIEETTPAADTMAAPPQVERAPVEEKPAPAVSQPRTDAEPAPEEETPKRIPPEGPRQPSWDPAAIQRVVHAHNAAIQDCYQQELKKSPSLRGRVIIRITIHPDGYVSAAEIAGTSLRSAPVLDCILRKIRQWSDFDPVDPAQGEITIRQSYRFGI